MDYLKDDHDLTSRRARDFADLQNEIAGRETGRPTRFLTAAGGKAEIEKRKREERKFRDALDALLATDPAYRALYIELGEKLRVTETETDAVISDLKNRIATLDLRVADMLDRTARLPDGRRVFRFADGRVKDEFGAPISPEIAEGIQWPPRAPRAEDYFAAIKDRQRLAHVLVEWEAYRNGTLGDIRDRYDDRNDPMEKEDLEAALEAIEEAKPPHPDHLEINASDLDAAAPTATAAVEIPKL